MFQQNRPLREVTRNFNEVKSSSLFIYVTFTSLFRFWTECHKYISFFHCISTSINIITGQSDQEDITVLCSAWSMSRIRNPASNFPTIFCVYRLSKIVVSIKRYDIENHRGIYLLEYQTFRKSRSSTIILGKQRFPACIFVQYIFYIGSLWIGLTLAVLQRNSSEISPIVSRRAVPPTLLVKIAKVQNRYSNYPNKKD